MKMGMLSSASPQYLELQAKVNDLVVGLGQAATGFIKVAVAKDSSAGEVTFECPFDCTIIRASACCTTANTAGTLQLRDGTTAIHAAAVCAVLDTTTAAATVDITYRNLVKGKTYNILAGGTDATLTRGELLLEVICE